MTRQQKVENIASVCWEANKAWCATHGYPDPPCWFYAQKGQRDSAIRGVEYALYGHTAYARHIAWTLAGPHAATPLYFHKTYEKLGAEQHAKDILFIAIVQALAPTLRLEANEQLYAAESRNRMEEEMLSLLRQPYSPR